jgi:DNA invertase Pin-like site-specific DNA recombinase
LNIAIYTRKSVLVENSESIQTQIDLCKKYFKENNNFEVFEDEGFSGGNTNRPAFKRMMNLCKLNKFNIVAVYKVDRISRNIIDFVNIYEELKNNNIKLVSITEGFDTQNAMGEMMMFMLSAFANMERENIRQRVKDNMISLANKGCYTGGYVPFGCEVQKVDGKSYLKIVDTELIKLMFDKYLELSSLYATQSYLKNNGFKTLATRSSLRDILRNPIYCKSDEKVSNYIKNMGYEIVGKANGKGYMTYGKRTNYPTAIVGKHKAVIDADTFLKVNMLLDANKDKTTKKESKTYWLTEILHCPFCGEKYIIVNSGKNTYYACSNRVNRSKDEMGIDVKKEKCRNYKYVNAVAIEEKIEKLIEGLENAKNFEEGYNSNNSDSKFENEIIVLEKSKLTNEKAINNLVEKLTVLSNAAATPVLKKIEELTVKNKELRDKIEELKLQQLENINTTSAKEIKNNINVFKYLKTNNDKRVAIRKIFNKLTYDPFKDKMNVEFLKYR